MPAKLLECVLNFSEGSDASFIEEIVDTIKTAKVIDLHSDPDHNRSVVTFIGDPKEVKQGAFDLTERAMQLLDVKTHEGVHPFIGVVDVIPFVPLKGCGMETAVEIAGQLGQDLWDKLKLPVYYYGEAAQKKERRDLSYVRRGGYKTLQLEIDQPERKPDVGQGLHPTAGATAVGARKFLIAFNIDLKTNDTTIAQSIANNIREKSGGLPGVKALGVPLKSRNISQVTINIVDHEKTSLGKVFDEVKKWSHEYQTEIVGSEIVGLIPASAVFQGMKEHLKLPSFSSEKILDNHL